MNVVVVVVIVVVGISSVADEFVAASCLLVAVLMMAMVAMMMMRRTVIYILIAAINIITINDDNFVARKALGARQDGLKAGFQRRPSNDNDGHVVDWKLIRLWCLLEHGR